MQSGPRIHATFDRQLARRTTDSRLVRHENIPALSASDWSTRAGTVAGGDTAAAVCLPHARGVRAPHGNGGGGGRLRGGRLYLRPGPCPPRPPPRK
eukprot:641281-Prorocentrum_minimum.AAC.4